MAVQDSGQIVRFGAFELDLRAGELRRSGIRLPVQGRPLQVLAILLKNPGQLVTTEQLRTELWSADTFVDFEHGVHNAVARLRAVLGDAAGKPRYIETLPRRGYRFIGLIDPAPPAPVVPENAVDPAIAPHIIRTRRRETGLRYGLVALACLLAAVGLAPWIYTRLGSHSASPRITSIAVLPLENLSGDPRQDYFADGITDELITMLAKINRVTVISRTSVMQYKGVHKPLRQIARELSVDGVVEGTVTRSGDRIRMTAQLIYAPADRHLWAERYERSTRDILLLEDEVARAIADRVGPEALRSKPGSQDNRHFTAHAIDQAAHESYLRGRYLLDKRSRPALEQAIQYFQDAIGKDPAYAQPYAGLADVYTVLGSWGMEAIPPQEALPKAKAAAEKALQLDDSSAEAHTSLATIRHIYEWDWRGAAAEYRRAIELNPSYANAHRWYGAHLCQLGRFDECITETGRAHTLDPTDFITGVDVGHRLYWARRYSEAIAPIQKALELDPDRRRSNLYLGQVYEAKGMYKEAVAEFQNAVQLSGGEPGKLAALGHAYALSGQPIEARKVLRILQQLSRQRYVSDYGIGLIYVGLGDKDRAMASLETEFQRRSTWMVHLKVDPRLDPLRADPRFIALVRRVGFPP